jgi:hypothetical protein
MLTDAELTGLAAQALNMAKRDLEQGDFNFLVASYHEGETLHRMADLETLVVERLGEDWLNHGATKDLGFLVFRTAVQLMPPDAFVFVTAGSAFKPTERFFQLPEAQQRELLDAGHDRHHQAVKDGILAINDALVAVAQTPERVCHYQQDLVGRGVFSKAQSFCAPQAEFDGRMKLFGG